MNKTQLIKKIAQGAGISEKQAAKALHAFENAINPKPQVNEFEMQIDNSFAWRGGSRKKGGKFRYIRK